MAAEIVSNFYHDGRLYAKGEFIEDEVESFFLRMVYPDCVVDDSKVTLPLSDLVCRRSAAVTPPGKNNPYSDQYKHPYWQKKRLEVMRHYNFMCQNCGASDKELHVHHTKYISGRKVWDYPTKYLLCLCSECHSKRHGKLASHDFGGLNA